MTEQQIIDHIRRQAESTGGGGKMELGIGDDCAIYRPKANEDLLFTTDFLIEDVHFRRALFPPDAVGHKALARSLSDIAAMGGDPQFCLLSLALPLGIGSDWLTAFFRGFLKLAKKYGTTLAGGDLSRSAKVTCDVMVCGSTPKGKALRRDGAKPGDVLYVSGKLGRGWEKYQRPEPRIALGKQLRGRATAAMDLSDGISMDLNRMCKASGVSATLQRIPLAKGASLEAALHGGEDYELLFAMPRRLKAPKGCFRVGTIEPGSPGMIRFQESALSPLGHDHFRSV